MLSVASKIDDGKDERKKNINRTFAYSAFYFGGFEKMANALPNDKLNSAKKEQSRKCLCDAAKRHFDRFQEKLRESKE